ncbi:ATP-dependent DNA helicase [Heterostelium album PN500]|uniref:ATP-dependent DNA helicase n=1 Tax=Heterostelium pallidum (strain ATCC 26659 / Pp 5 / PN500) TaxID=670386 RepID=D3BLJ3_HETP5|nr:ATP-dependent DNA helicase [Heterostelium album PN500]EFA77444.1 ATP-dependent DNA helicase [Heterostelium album PN500]|eukprot:XP_020429572.1 ATP-dependent DNA helicase [Heterostelium album PN500]
MTTQSIPTKEALVVILDIGLGMHQHSNTNKQYTTTPIEEALKSATLLYQQKLLYGKKDELGVVLIGTKETKNNLQKDGYHHITTQTEIEEPTLETLKFLEQLKPGQSRGDIIDALIVAMDMLIHKTAKKKYQKRIFLVTNCYDPINKDDLSTLRDQFKKIDVKLNIIGVDFTDEEELENKIKLTKKEENEKFLREFAESVDGVLVPVKQALEMMSFFRSQSVLQRTVFRDTGVVVYEDKDSEFTDAWKGVDSGATAKGRATRCQNNNRGQTGEALLFDKRSRYRVGLFRVTERIQKVPIYHNKGSTEMMVSPPGDKVARSALSSLIHGMAETKQALLARYVKRNGSSPSIALLYPHIKANYESLYVCQLPFLDDLKQYQFPPIAPTNPATRKPYIPTAEQVDAARALIDSMDLMTAEEDEDHQKIAALRPRFTYNPSLQHFYQCLHHRALHPESQLPKLDPIISKYINPDEAIMENAQDAIKNFQILFPLTKTTNFKSEPKYRWQDGMLVEQQQEIRLDSYVTDDTNSSKKRKADDLADYSLDKLVSGYVNEVGSINPVQNFKDMLARRDIDLVDKAISLMKQRIVQLVNDSLKDQFYQKALECVVALRRGSIKESESLVFNQFLRELRDYYESKKRDDFWQLIVTNQIGLITNDESDDSEITEKESKEFLGSKRKTIAINNNQPSKSDSVDDLFDQIE